MRSGDSERFNRVGRSRQRDLIRSENPGRDLMRFGDPGGVILRSGDPGREI